MKEQTCAKCGRKTDASVLVSPIDKNGRNLDRVFLCYDCGVEWGHAYKSVCSKDKGDNDEFRKNWAMRWQKFMKGDFDKEEVEFT